MSDEAAGTLLEEVRDLMGDQPNLAELKPVLFAMARAHDREVSGRQADRRAQRSEYLRLQGVQITILLAMLTIVGLVIQGLGR